jgi:hypothetical protein
LNKVKASFNAHSQKMRTNTQLRALRFTATVSFAIFKIDDIGVQTEKKKVIYACHSSIIFAAGHTFHHSIQ